MDSRKRRRAGSDLNEAGAKKANGKQPLRMRNGAPTGSVNEDMMAMTQSKHREMEDTAQDIPAAREEKMECGEEEEDEEDEVLVVLELCDFKNHPIFDDHRSCQLGGIDTANPVLHIGEYKLYGKLEETVGTNFFYDIKNRTEDNAYRYTGQTTKKIKFTISPPE
ncbi:TPA: hypothetical protein N0F65_010177 [Lagenidium giganteum]|uniref:Transcription factor TFIIIC triple barrel domain-containing protein n=1 Tax=Lagenidium giganteum TaxID=4803 RepID=A0AAV2Z8L8_9STRA|nr:TPA: hypothetical protein N0F65_010177 [Lagenidium giganteum]